MELGGVSELDVATDLIQYHLEKADATIRELASAPISDTVLSEAIAVEAAYRTLTSLDETYHDESRDVQLSDSYNVEARIETLEKRRVSLRRKVSGGGLFEVY